MLHPGHHLRKHIAIKKWVMSKCQWSLTDNTSTSLLVIKSKERMRQRNTPLSLTFTRSTNLPRISTTYLSLFIQGKSLSFTRRLSLSKRMKTLKNLLVKWLSGQQTVKYFFALLVQVMFIGSILWLEKNLGTKHWHRTTANTVWSITTISWTNS